MQAAYTALHLALSDQVARWEGHMDWDDGWWIVMMIGMALVLALVALGVVWLIRSLQSDREGRREAAPLDVLDRGLAEGSISVEEYEQRRQILLKSSGDGAR